MPALSARLPSPLATTARWLAMLSAALAIGVAGWIGYCEYRNSVDAPPPSESELRERLSRARHWIYANSESLLNDDNAVLWLFVRDAGRTTGDLKLLDLASEFQVRRVNGTLMQYLFDPDGSEQIAGQQVAFDHTMDDYKRLFVYGATCNGSAREDAQVQALLDPKGCIPHLMWLRSPWCRTHQLMGLRFVQKNRCEPDADTAATVRKVQDGILSELHWDFRVEDAYLQKILTLLESGRRRDIKAVWVRRILEAQRPDGGWDGVDVIAHLPGDRVLAWAGGRLYPVITSPPASTFHATAQGLYLLALLLQDGH